MAGETPGPTIAEAGEGDVAAIAAFFWDAWRMSGPDAPGWAGASEEAMAEITAPDTLLGRIGGPDRRMFLAREKDRVVAFAATRRIDAGSAELAGIVVRQDRLGLGIGTPLLEAAVRAMVADGYARLVVRTEATNDRAIGFYLSRGFLPEAVVVEDVEGMQVKVQELSRPL